MNCAEACPTEINRNKKPSSFGMAQVYDAGIFQEIKLETKA